MKKFLLYGHGGAYNHGAEAIVRCTCDALRHLFPHCQIELSTHFPEQDYEFSLPVDFYLTREEQYVATDKNSSIKGLYDEQIYASTINAITSQHICLSVGGDNYCYENWRRWKPIHARAFSCGAIDILWSCSIEPAALSEEMLSHLQSFDLITARESLTYEALRTRGLKNVELCSDVAFLLKEKETSIPEQFLEGNTIAVNISPLVLRREARTGILMQNVECLIDYILLKTGMNILLIPHVLMPMDNDLELLEQLKKKYKNNPFYEKRICLIRQNISAAERKYLIARCKFGIFSRTHASIAAYSSGVPCIVLGYSVKSAGIGKDVGMSDYVLPIDRVTEPTILLQLFIRLMSDENDKRSLLQKKQAEMCQRAKKNMLYLQMCIENEDKKCK